MTSPFIALDDLAARVAAGALLALPPDYAGPAMAAVREVIRARTGDLRLLGVPQLGLQADLMIGAGLVASVETAAVTLGEHGLAPRFTAAVKAGRLRIVDSTCPAIHGALQAAEKGSPFMALRGILGSDILAHRPDWKVIDNPFAADRGTAQTGQSDPVVLLPAIQPDVALFHAPLADRAGNVWIGVRRELMLMAHAAKTTLVTVEKVVEDDLLADPRMAAGTIPGLYVSGLAEVAGGAWPVGFWGGPKADAAWLARYAAEAKSDAGFQRLLTDWLAAGAEPRAAHG